MIDEDQIMESIDNLDMLLANMQGGQTGQGKKQALDKLVKKYKIEPPANQVPPQQNPNQQNYQQPFAVNMAQQAQILQQ